MNGSWCEDEKQGIIFLFSSVGCDKPKGKKTKYNSSNLVNGLCIICIYVLCTVILRIFLEIRWIVYSIVI